MLKRANIFGCGGRKRKESRNINVSMKHLCRVGKAVALDDVLSLRMLEERIKDYSAAFQQQTSEKLAELERVKLLKIVKPIADEFIKRKSLIPEMRLLIKA